MAWLAWLMLALAPFGAGSASGAALQRGAGAAVHASHGSMSMGEAMHAGHSMAMSGPTHAGVAHCCDGDAGQHPDAPATHTCHCAVSCTSLLPVPQAHLAALPAAPARYAPPRPLEAPLSGFTPPLRPPLG